MRKLLGSAAVAVASTTTMFTLAPGTAHADDGSCVWYEDGDEYPEGTGKEEYWGTETRPDGTVVHRYRLWRCSHGAWWYEGDKYYPAERDDDDDDDGWDDGGHEIILT